MITCVNPIPIYTDNYIWLIEFGDRKAVVVDPGDARPVIKALRKNRLDLQAILVTHNHWDHVDGILPLLNEYPVPVYGPASGRTPGLTHPCHEGTQTHLAGLTLEVLEVPGHTADHIAYYGDQCLFCGDTLFAAGCGRLLGGTAVQLYDSLTKLAGLPITTHIYCTHEYTLANLRFAAAVEPGNPQIMERTAVEMDKRQQHLPTVPTTLAVELATNPFLRCDVDEVAASAEHFAGKKLGTPAEVFKVLRFWKDGFS